MVFPSVVLSRCARKNLRGRGDGLLQQGAAVMKYLAMAPLGLSLGMFLVTNCVAIPAMAQPRSNCLEGVAEAADLIEEVNEELYEEGDECIAAIAQIRNGLRGAQEHCDRVKVYVTSEYSIFVPQMEKDLEDHVKSARDGRRRAGQECQSRGKLSRVGMFFLLLAPTSLMTGLVALADWTIAKNAEDRTKAISTTATSGAVFVAGTALSAVVVFGPRSRVRPKLDMALMPILIERGSGLELVGKF